LLFFFKKEKIKLIFERVGVTWRLLKRLRVILIEVISSADLGGSSNYSSE